ncbi:MAG TPA: EI24 domain-containing protein [Propionibacteriaceae bacterium]|nr:EI24 domain-containing protein [Propionibacteriaceae bacterium]
MAGAVREFLAGAALLPRGLSLIARRPRLFGLGAIPPAITSVIFIGVLVAVILQVERIVDWLTPFADAWSPGVATTVRVLVGVALVAGLVLIMVISFTALTLALGSPIYDKLSESVEREFGPVPQLDEPVRTGAVRAVRQTSAMIGTSALVALPLFAVGFIPVVGQTVVPVVSAAFGGWMLGLELTGPAFERRNRLTIAERRAAMRKQRARVLGFAVPTFLLLAIPLVGVLVFPIATAAGTLLARQLLGEPT